MNNNTNTLLIHIGTPKTGTTALQSFFLNNLSTLEKYGWCYPILNDGEMGYWDRWEVERFGNGYKIYDAWIVNGMRSEWDKGWEAILRYLNNKNVIISAEDIYMSGTDKFLADAKEKYGNIKVIVYLRRQDRVTESRYNQQVKGSIVYQTFDEFVSSDAVAENFLEYAMKLDSISQIIGKENLIIRVYEKQQLIGNNTVTDFLSAIGVPTDQDNWERSQEENRSLGGNYLEINRLLNSVLYVDSLMGSGYGLQAWTNWKVKTDFRNVCVELSNALERNKEIALFTTNKRKEFLERFASDNEYIAREYLHREDGILFKDVRMDFPVLEMDQHTDFEADMIRVFAAMMYAQAYRFGNLLEKNTMNIVGRLLMKEALRKSKNRKIMLFGAGHNCQKLVDAVGNMQVSIADNDITKQNMILGGAQVRYAKDITEWQEYFVIVTCQETKEIEEQLHSLGLKKEEDYILMSEYVL